MLYYILINNEPIGPMTASQMCAYNVNPNTQVSAEGGEWRPLYSYPELMAAINERQHKPQNAGGNGDSVTEGTKTACGILALLIGGIGLQYFLVGKTTGGIINIALTAVTCGLWSIINFIQGILILCMSFDEWRRKWVDSDSTFPIF